MISLLIVTFSQTVVKISYFRKQGYIQFKNSNGIIHLSLIQVVITDPV
jgi:hypothetical protein